MEKGFYRSKEWIRAGGEGSGTREGELSKFDECSRRVIVEKNMGIYGIYGGYIRFHHYDDVYDFNNYSFSFITKLLFMIIS